MSKGLKMNIHNEEMFPEFTDKKIKSFTVPNIVKEIGLNAFENCTELEKVILPEGLIKIDAMALKNPKTAAKCLTQPFCFTYDWTKLN